MNRLAAAVLVLVTAATAGAQTLYVSPSGNDDAAGGADDPLASLAGARERVKSLRQEGRSVSEVVFESGSYRFAEPVRFDASDSGSPEVPITYRTRPGEEVRFSGGVTVSGWVPAEVPAGWSGDGEYGVVIADLRGQGITDYGEIPLRPGSVMESEPELLWNDIPLELARFPNEGFRGIHEVSADLRRIKLDTYRARRWTREPDPWIMAYWYYDWAEQYEPIVAIASEAPFEISRLAEINTRYGVSPGRARWYAFNLLSELDRPGEYYLDRSQGLIHAWPPSAEGGAATLSTSTGIVRIDGASHLTFRGFTFEACRGAAITMAGGTGNRIVGCTIRNTGDRGIHVDGGEGHEVYGCDIYRTGGGGISMSGGDRAALTPSGFNVENNHVHDYARRKRTYRPAISVNGVGSRIAHNLINDGPHMALAAFGNDHVLEYNEIHNVVYESGDAGAYYVGRDWTQRGVVLRYNYWHNIVGSGGHGGMTVYLDDQHCGHTIHGNLFVRCSNAAFLGGGDDNKVTNNVFINCRSAAHLDARGASSIAETLHRRLSEVPYRSALWRERYPMLYGILDDDPHVPKRNLFFRNISAGGKWDDIDTRTRSLQTIDANLVFDDDPEWVTVEEDSLGRPARLNFKDTEAVAAIGFEELPLARMGVYEDDRRASWPVVHEVIDVEFAPPKPRIDLKDSPVFAVQPSTAPVMVDGRLEWSEWCGFEPEKAMSLLVEVRGAHVNRPAQAWLSHDGSALRVAVRTALPPTRHLGSTWGLSDAVELAFRDEDDSQQAVLVFRGFTEGSWEVTMEDGTPPLSLEALRKDVRYGAAIAEETWTAEWQIPFENIGAATGEQLRFNLTVRRVEGSLWLMWRPTYGHSYDVWRTGSIKFMP